MKSKKPIFNQKPRSAGEFFECICDICASEVIPENIGENAENGISLLFIDDKRQGGDANREGLGNE